MCLCVYLYYSIIYYIQLYIYTGFSLFLLLLVFNFSLLMNWDQHVNFSNNTLDHFIFCVDIFYNKSILLHRVSKSLSSIVLHTVSLNCRRSSKEQECVRSGHSNIMYNDNHRGQPIADVISNSDHITLNTKTPTRVPKTTLYHTSSPDITTVSNTLYNRTSRTTQHALSSDHLPIITTINIRHDYRLQQNRRTFTNYKKADWTQFTEDTESAFAQTTIPTNIHTANIIFTNIILMADKHNIPKGKIHSNHL